MWMLHEGIPVDLVSDEAYGRNQRIVHVCRFCMRRFRWIKYLMKHVGGIREWFMFVDAAWKDFCRFKIWRSTWYNGSCLWRLQEGILVDWGSEESNQRMFNACGYCKKEISRLRIWRIIWENCSCLWIQQERISVDWGFEEAHYSMAYTCGYSRRGF